MKPTIRLQIRSNSIISYIKYPDRKVIRPESGRNIKLFVKKGETEKSKTYSGELCAGAKKRLTKSIEFLVMKTKELEKINPVTCKKQKFRLTFLTLTVYSPERNIKGKEAHTTLLEPFLQYMRRNHDIRLYIWKAELQKRDQIHYHLVFDGFIHYQDVRNEWNRLQKKAGYLDAFFEKYGRWNAPSTHIHSVKKIRNMGQYMAKLVTEMTKTFQSINSEAGENIAGKVWDCSRELKGNKYFSVPETVEYEAELYELIKNGQCRYTSTEHCIIYKTTIPAYEILSIADRLSFDNYIFGTHNVLPEDLPPKIVHPPQLTLFSYN